MRVGRSSLTICILRWLFDQGSRKTSLRLQGHVPSDIKSFTDVIYDNRDPDGRIDVFYPEHQASPLPVIVWLHGGGWFTGSKSDVANYLKILAAKGFVTVGVEYTTALRATYPTPVHQTIAALAYLNRHAAEYGIDPNNMFLAGDSTGAQIAAQTALIITDESYADNITISSPLTTSQLRGMILYCGAYDLSLIDGDKRYAWLTRKILSTYFGRSDFENINGYELASVAANITKAFPSTFISVGNGDPLAPFSYSFADQLESAGVSVDRLFFDPKQSPKLAHEYQFNLDSPFGQESLNRVVDFVNSN